ncbi:ankyrin, partial [Cadophora sp. DSE1049]
MHDTASVPSSSLFNKYSFLSKTVNIQLAGMDGTMLSAKLGGRPINKWNSSRRRKLVRLYSLTTLDKDEIRAVLKAHDFDPSSSDIQKKLRHLFPRDYAKDYRAFRPLNRKQMNTRLSSIRRKPSTRITAADRIHIKNAFQHDHLGAFEGPQIAFRTCLGGEAETISPEKLSLSNIQPHVPFDVLPTSPRTALDVRGSEKLYVLNLGSGAEIVNPSLLLLDGSSVVQKPANSAEGIEATTLDCVPGTRTDARKRARFSLRSSGASLQSLERRLGRRSQSFVGHVDSVLRISLTNSWRSSLSWGSNSLVRLSSHDEALPDPDRISLNPPSIVPSNQQRSTTSVQPWYDPLAPEERRTWNKLIQKAELSCYPDDGKLGKLKRNEFRELSIEYDYGRGPHVRLCCKKLSGGRVGRCLRCGSDTIHRRLLAHADGSSLQPLFPSPFNDLENLLNEPDNLGNTPLHYAAVGWAGNPDHLRGLLVTGMKGHLRNVLGQTFLHVLLGCVSFASLPSLCDLLRYLKSIGFDFTTRDFHGRTAVLHLFATATLISEQHFPFLQDILQITGHELATVDSRGHSLNHHVRRLSNVSNQHIDPQRLEAFISTLPVSQNSQSRFCKKIGQSDSRNWPGWISWVSECNRSTWVDALGDTPVLALIKYWEHFEDDELQIPAMIKELVSFGADIHMRDRNGETALSVAVKRGLRPAVVTLIYLGASQYSKGDDGKTIMGNGQAELRRAQREGNDKRYAMILSCITYLVDCEGYDPAFI